MNKNYRKQLDGGLMSRKLWLAVGSIGTISLAALLSTKIPSLVPLYDTFVGGVLGALGLYLTGNVGARFVHKDAANRPEPEDGPPVEGEQK